MGETQPWFARFIVRDVTLPRGRFVDLVFPLGLDLDAAGFAELWRAFPKETCVRWSLGALRPSTS